MPTLQLAQERTFLSDRELFGSPLNCSMSGGVSYCSAFPEDSIFGATTDSFRYRWTGSCIAKLEYELDAQSGSSRPPLLGGARYTLPSGLDTSCLG